MFKIDIVYKFFVAFILIFAILFLFISGIAFTFGFQDTLTLLWHKICGISLGIAAVLHIIINRKKVVKLLNEFIDVITNRANPSYCNMNRLISAFKPYTIAQLAKILDINDDDLLTKLTKSGINIKSKDQTIAEISRINHEKIFFSIVVILEIKLIK